MVDDKQSRKPERTLGEDRPTRSTYRPLRLIMIVFVLLVATAVGFHFKSHSNPGTEPSSFNGQPPQYINVYTTGGDIKIAVTVILGQGWLNPNYDRYGPVELRAQGVTDFHEEVEFTATYAGSGKPEAIIIASSTRPLTGADSPGGPISVFQLKGAEGSLAQANRFAAWFPLPRDQGNTWSGSVSFNSVPIIFQNNGSTFGHLPSVGAYGYLYPPISVLQGRYDAGTGRLENMAFTTPDSPGGANIEYFSPPNTQASYSEVIQHIAPALSDRQIAYMNPSADSANDADYIWQSNSSIDGLEPTFKAIDLDATDSQSQAAFYSGIAFGVAGAAVIALVQEIPEERKRKSSRSGARNRERGT
jgi:hypothetical protein